jgi:NAD(P)-dependent dehydrogenase (short-subunit alcohol dehydrogenase family)
MELGLKGRKVIVTGSSKGIGAATARAFAAEGARVALVARDKTALKAVAERIGNDTVVAPADLSTADGASAAIATCIDGLGGIDVLVNNAGASRFGSFDDITDQDWEDAFKLKFMGYTRCMRAVLPAMRAQRFGRIINIGGTASLKAPPGYVLSAINAALVHLTRSTAELVGKDGITVVSVHPGATMTERLHTMLAAGAAAANMDVNKFAAAPVTPSIPLRRIATPEEIAAMIVVLASDVAAYVTGGGLTIDGGAATGVVGG